MVGGREQVKAPSTPAPKVRLDPEPPEARVVALLERGGHARAEFKRLVQQEALKALSTPEATKTPPEPPRRRHGQSQCSLPHPATNRH